MTQLLTASDLGLHGAGVDAKAVRVKCLAALGFSTLGLLTACGADEPEPAQGDPKWVPPPEMCEASADGSFAPCTRGSGSFGQWAVDDLGLVAYDYKLDQHDSPLAGYELSEPNTDGEPLFSHLHWGAFGNRRVNAWLTNDGFIEVVNQDRGVEYLNKFDAETGSYSGGFSWLDDGEKAWSTAYRWRPETAKTSRRFAMGYAETSMTYRGVRVLRRTTAPTGDVPAVVSDVTIENLSDEPKQLVHYEYWDVGRRPIEINWLVSGAAVPLAPATTRKARDARNGWFDESVSYQADEQRLLLRRSWAGAAPRKDPAEPSAEDQFAHDPFLQLALGNVSDLWVTDDSFFGAGDPAAPDAVRDRRAGMAAAEGVLSERNGQGQPHLFVIKSDVSLAAGAQQTLRFVFGYARSGESPARDERWSFPEFSARDEYAEALRDKLAFFSAEAAPELTRELAWHSYQLEASVGYRDYWQGPIVPQGSAYLYLHGADGAARDLGLFAAPLIYTDPELAKAELRFYTGIQYDTGRFSYAFQGHGMLDDAGIHSAPSDLCLFFLWALGEYLGATGDLAFLDEPAPFWPRTDSPADATVWTHVVRALRHQFDVIGTGEHGLIRVQTGDWSDGIVVEAPNRELAVEKGESVPNTQMAIAVLPRIADLIEARDAALAAEIRDKVQSYRAALPAAWNGSHFVRAFFGDGKPVYDGTINLESQIWALIGDSFASDEDRDQLIAKIEAKLHSPLGATLTPGAQVWPAISAPLTWGYALHDGQRAWDHFVSNTMAAQAVQFPDVWSGIWSGPDGVSSKSGRTWQSQVTPMTDFPVQNNNAHTMRLLAAIRIAGLDANADGLIVAPRTGKSLSLRTALADVEASHSAITVSYRPRGDRTLRILAPPGQRIDSVDTTAAATLAEDGRTLTVPAPAQDELEVAVTLVSDG